MQDVIAEGTYVREMVSKLTLQSFDLMYIFLQKKLASRSNRLRLDTSQLYTHATGFSGLQNMLPEIDKENRYCNSEIEAKSSICGFTQQGFQK